MKWTKELEDKLTSLYPNTPNYDLVKIFNVSEKTLTCKAYRLQLIKTKECKGYLIGKRNKMVGRDLSVELLTEIALNYKTRSEFQYGDSSAYTTARRKGLLKDICKHMSVINFSIPQLILKDIMDNILGLDSEYDTRQIVKPYEIDVYYPTLKLGFEYQGKLWHKEKYNNNRDLIKAKICLEVGITLIYIIENNRRYEEDIKNQIINQLSKINELAGTSIKETDIVNYIIGNIYSKLYNESELMTLAKSYTSFKEFIKSEPKVYTKLRRMKLLDKATSHMKDRVCRRNESEVKEVIKKYINLGDLIKNDHGTYLYVKKNKLTHLVSHLKSRFNK